MLLGKFCSMPGSLSIGTEPTPRATSCLPSLVMRRRSRTQPHVQLKTHRSWRKRSMNHTQCLTQCLGLRTFKRLSKMREDILPSKTPMEQFLYDIRVASSRMYRSHTSFHYRSCFLCVEPQSEATCRIVRTDPYSTSGDFNVPIPTGGT